MNQSCGCFPWLSSSKQARSFQDENDETRVVKTAPAEATRPNFPETRSSTGNSENRNRLSRESGRSRASSSELPKRVSFSDNSNPCKSFSNMSSLKATGARKYPTMLDLQEDDLIPPLSSDASIKTVGSLHGSITRPIESTDLSLDTKIAEGSAHKLMEDAVDKLASTIHSTLFPKPPAELRYVMKIKDENDEDLYLM
jgi:hypothetical protein